MPLHSEPMGRLVAAGTRRPVVALRSPANLSVASRGVPQTELVSVPARSTPKKTEDSVTPSSELSRTWTGMTKQESIVAKDVKDKASAWNLSSPSSRSKASGTLDSPLLSEAPSFLPPSDSDDFRLETPVAEARGVCRAGSPSISEHGTSTHILAPQQEPTSPNEALIAQPANAGYLGLGLPPAFAAPYSSTAAAMLVPPTTATIICRSRGDDDSLEQQQQPGAQRSASGRSTVLSPRPLSQRGVSFHANTADLQTLGDSSLESADSEERGLVIPDGSAKVMPEAEGLKPPTVSRSFLSFGGPWTRSPRRVSTGGASTLSRDSRSECGNTIESPSGRPPHKLLSKTPSRFQSESGDPSSRLRRRPTSCIEGTGLRHADSLIDPGGENNGAFSRLRVATLIDRLLGMWESTCAYSESQKPREYQSKARSADLIQCCSPTEGALASSVGDLLAAEESDLSVNFADGNKSLSKLQLKGRASPASFVHHPSRETEPLSPTGRGSSWTSQKSDRLNRRRWTSEDITLIAGGLSHRSRDSPLRPQVKPEEVSEIVTMGLELARELQGFLHFADVLESENLALEDKADDLAGELEQLAKEHEIQLQKHQGKISELRDQIECLELQLENQETLRRASPAMASSDTKSDTSASAASLEGSSQLGRKSDDENLQTRMENLRQEYNQRLRELEEHTAELYIVKEVNSRLQSECTTKTFQIQQLKQELTVRQDQAEELRNRYRSNLEAAQLENDQLRLSLSGLEAQHSALLTSNSSIRVGRGQQPRSVRVLNCVSVSIPGSSTPPRNCCDASLDDESSEDFPDAEPLSIVAFTPSPSIETPPRNKSAAPMHLMAFSTCRAQLSRFDQLLDIPSFSGDVERVGLSEAFRSRRGIAQNPVTEIPRTPPNFALLRNTPIEFLSVVPNPAFSLCTFAVVAQVSSPIPLRPRSRSVVAEVSLLPAVKRVRHGIVTQPPLSDLSWPMGEPASAGALEAQKPTQPPKFRRVTCHCAVDLPQCAYRCRFARCAITPVEQIPSHCQPNDVSFRRVESSPPARLFPLLSIPRLVGLPRDSRRSLKPPFAAPVAKTKSLVTSPKTNNCSTTNSAAAAATDVERASPLLSSASRLLSSSSSSSSSSSLSSFFDKDLSQRSSNSSYSSCNTCSRFDSRWNYLIAEVVIPGPDPHRRPHVVEDKDDLLVLPSPHPTASAAVVNGSHDIAGTVHQAPSEGQYRRQQQSPSPQPFTRVSICEAGVQCKVSTPSTMTPDFGTVKPTRRLRWHAVVRASLSPSSESSRQSSWTAVTLSASVIPHCYTRARSFAISRASNISTIPGEQGVDLPRTTPSSEAVQLAPAASLRRLACSLAQQVTWDSVITSWAAVPGKNLHIPPSDWLNSSVGSTCTSKTAKAHKPVPVVSLNIERGSSTEMASPSATLVGQAVSSTSTVATATTTTITTLHSIEQSVEEELEFAHVVGGENQSASQTACLHPFASIVEEALRVTPRHGDVSPGKYPPFGMQTANESRFRTRTASMQQTQCGIGIKREVPAPGPTIPVLMPSASAVVVGARQSPRIICSRFEASVFDTPTPLSARRRHQIFDRTPPSGTPTTTASVSQIGGHKVMAFGHVHREIGANKVTLVDEISSDTTMIPTITLSRQLAANSDTVASVVPCRFPRILPPLFETMPLTQVSNLETTTTGLDGSVTHSRTAWIKADLSVSPPSVAISQAPMLMYEEPRFTSASISAGSPLAQSGAMTCQYIPGPRASPPVFPMPLGASVFVSDDSPLQSSAHWKLAQLYGQALSTASCPMPARASMGDPAATAVPVFNKTNSIHPLGPVAMTATSGIPCNGDVSATPKTQGPESMAAVHAMSKTSSALPTQTASRRVFGPTICPPAHITTYGYHPDTHTVANVGAPVADASASFTDFARLPPSNQISFPSVINGSDFASTAQANLVSLGGRILGAATRDRPLPGSRLRNESATAPVAMRDRASAMVTKQSGTSVRSLPFHPPPSFGIPTDYKTTNSASLLHTGVTLHS